MRVERSAEVDAGTGRRAMTQSMRSPQRSGSASCRTCRPRRSDVVAGDRVNELIARARVASTDEQTCFVGPLAIRARAARKPASSTSLDGMRLGDEAAGAGLEGALARFLRRDDAHRDVPRRQVVLEAVQHAPAVHVGQADVEGDRVGLDNRAQAQAPRRPASDEPLAALVARGFEQEPARTPGRSRRSAAPCRPAGSSSRSSSASLASRAARQLGARELGLQRVGPAGVRRRRLPRRHRLGASPCWAGALQRGGV